MATAGDEITAKTTRTKLTEYWGGDPQRESEKDHKSTLGLF